METFLKKLLIFGFMPLIFFTSCSKSDSPKADVITYKLILKATTASEGTTTFNEISYRKADGSIAKLTNLTTDFEESFTIAKNFNILYNVTGVNNGSNIPNLSITYEIKKIVNGEQKETICYGSQLSKSGSAGSWSFYSNNDFTFTEKGCQ